MITSHKNAPFSQLNIIQIIIILLTYYITMWVFTQWSGYATVKQEYDNLCDAFAV